jgi:hypothetical protein
MKPPFRVGNNFIGWQIVNFGKLLRAQLIRNDEQADQE